MRAVTIRGFGDIIKMRYLIYVYSTDTPRIILAGIPNPGGIQRTCGLEQFIHH